MRRITWAWADSIALIWAIIVWGFLILIASDREGMIIGLFFSSEGIKLFLLIIAPVWLICRVLDVMTGGPLRRRALMENQVVGYWIPRR